MTRNSPAILRAVLLVSLSMMLSGKFSFGATNKDLTAGISVTSQTGLFAVGTSTGEFSSQLTLTPSIEFQLSTRRTALGSSYQLRFSTRSDDLEQLRLNLYQQASIQKNITLSRTATWSSQLSGNMGILDYNTALLLYDEDSDVAPNLPEQDNINTYSISISSGVSKRLTYLSQGTFSFNYQTYRSFGYDSDSPALFSDQNRLSVQAGFGQTLSRRDFVAINFNGGLVDNSPGAAYIPILTELEWRRALSSTSSGSLLGGLNTIYQLRSNSRTDESNEDGQIFLLPRAGFSYRTQSYLRSRKSLTSTISGTLNVYFDRVTTSVQQLGQLAISESFSLPPSWVITAQVNILSLFSPDTIEPPPSGGIGSTTGDYPTTIALRAGATYDMNRLSVLSFGISTNIRTTHIWDPPVDVAGFREILFYLSISARKKLF